MDETALILVAFTVLAFGLVSRRLERTMVTPPMVFVLWGALVGARGLGLLEVDVAQGTAHLLLEVTLILVLFGDATRIDLRALRRELGLPVRLLGVGMPLTILLGAALAKLAFPDLGLFEAALVGAILAPTDAALGQAVVSSSAVPLRVRQALNVESGLNDGIALPLVMIFAALASMEDSASRPAGEWVRFVLLQVTVGPAAGAAIGWIGGRLVDRADRRGWMNASFERLAGLSLALLAFAVAEELGGNGFMSAFAAGLALGAASPSRCGWLYEFLEAEVQLLMLLVFMLFGASLEATTHGLAFGPLVLYVAASLTLVRMLPVAVAMRGAGLRPVTVAFLGWFGPRGLASLLFGVLILEQIPAAHGEQILAVVVATVLASVFAHGLTAVPAARRYASAMRDPEHCPGEHRPVTAHALRARD